MSKDTIYRQDAIDALGEEPMVWCNENEYELGERNQWNSDVLAIKAVPSAQPEDYAHGFADGYKQGEKDAQPEIIRCKDCKWKQGSECVRFADVRPFPDDFCSRAERRTDEQ